MPGPRSAAAETPVVESVAGRGVGLRAGTDGLNGEYGHFVTANVHRKDLQWLPLALFLGLVTLKVMPKQRRLTMPSRPEELHLEPLTDPDVTLSRYPARAIQ
jgi:hypothetical protein